MLDFNDPGQVKKARQIIAEIKAAGEILSDALDGKNMQEKYTLIYAFCLKYGDQWEDFMGNDTLDFFCSDCAEMLPTHLVGGVCDRCEISYQELWG